MARKQYEAEGDREGRSPYRDEDLRSLKELTVLGLKGMAAYYEHAARLNERNEEIIAFIEKALAIVSNPEADMDTLLATVMEQVSSVLMQWHYSTRLTLRLMVTQNSQR